jgi:hypothetical protein
VESLAAAVEELFALDPDALSDAELHATVIGLQRQESRFAAARARLLAAWDARKIWADDGSKAAAARLARECSLATQTTRAELRRARKLRGMPQTAEALRDGKLSIDQAKLLAFANQPDVAHLFARDEACSSVRSAGCGSSTASAWCATGWRRPTTRSAPRPSR